MTKGLPAKSAHYPEHSGINLPQQWTVKKLKHIGSLANGATPQSGVEKYWGGDILWVTPTDINNIKYIQKTERQITKLGYVSCGTTKVPKDAIVITTRAPIGKVAVAARELCTNQGCKSLVLNDENHSAYIYYILVISSDILNSLGTGTTFMELSSFELKNFKLLSPPLEEQISISSFLDKKTKQIDDAIAIKQRQIELLKERKQILIQNAVTRGLNPDVPMRDSGVEWIGKIPEHWQVKRAKYLFVEVDERSKDGSEELLSVSHMTGVTPRSEKNVTMFMAEDYTGSKTCQKDDLVFNIMWAWMGALGVSDRPGIVSSAYGVFRQKKKGSFDSDYLELLLKTSSYIDHYNKISTGLHSSRLRFYPHMFFDMELGFPQKSEQDQIVEFINAQSSKVDTAIDLQQQQIKKLKEYKATLIDSAVTGKIKVPQLAKSEVVA